MKAEPAEAGEASTVRPPKQGSNRWIYITDLVLRAVAVIGTLASALTMGTTDETLPFSTPFVQFTAEYYDLPTFT